MAVIVICLFRMVPVGWSAVCDCCISWSYSLFKFNSFFVIVIPWVVRMYVEIIHELKRVDYLTYRWTNIVLLFYTTFISVNLAYHEIFRA